MRVPHALLLTIMLAALCCGQEEASWKALNLASVEFPGATLHYERQLGEHVRAFRGIYEQFLAEEAERERMIFKEYK